MYKPINLSSLAIGAAVTVCCGKMKRQGRIIATDIKGDRPIAVAYIANDKELIALFKADGSTSTDYYYIELDPVIRYEYQNLWENKSAQASRFESREDAQKAAEHSISSLRIGQKLLNTLELKFEDDVLVDVRLMNDL